MAPHSSTTSVGLAAYAALMRAMPRSYRAEYGEESLQDLREILAEAHAPSRLHALRSTVRACTDLLLRLPREWWAEWTTRPALGRGRYVNDIGMGDRMMEGFRTFRLAGRALSKRPGFALVATLTLALGIGANVAVFAIVNGVLLQPLPYENSSQIVTYEHHAPGLDLPTLLNSEGMIAFYEERAPFIEATAAWGQGRSNLAGDGDAARVDVVAFSPDLFDVLRVQPLLGRPFTDADTGPDFRQGSSVALLGHGLWQTRFGGDPNVIGRSIELDGNTIEIIGVMPESFLFPEPGVDLYRALYVDPEGSFGAFGTPTVSRLAPGITAEIAQQRLTDLHSLLPEVFTGMDASFFESAGFSVSVATLRDRLVRDVESTLWIVLGTVGFVFLIACANVANLFLVRAESRQKEMAIRSAMGAGRKSVISSFLSESVILGLAGGLLGMAFAFVSVPALLSIADLPRGAEVSIDLMAFAFAGALSLVAGVVFGSFAAFRYAGGPVTGVLRDGSRGSTSGPGRSRARNLLVATQLALGLVLLVGSGLMLRSFGELRALDIGIEADDVLTLQLNRNQGEDHAITGRFFQDAAERIAALPGVQSVGAGSNLPLASGSSNGGSFFIESQPRADDELPPIAMYRKVGPGYFAALDIPLLEGRDVERADSEEPRSVVWVNEAFAREFFDGEAIGERISWNDPPDDTPPGGGPYAEIVGVVGNVRELGLEEDDLRPLAYFPLVAASAVGTDLASASLAIEVVEGVDPVSLADAVQAELRAFAPGVPITATRTMDDIVGEAMEATSVTMIVIAIATGMALFLAAIGLAGVISYVVGQRTREIGVRVALGASAGTVGGMIIKQSMFVTALGTVLGLVGAFGLTRLMEALLFGVSATDPVTFAAAPVILILVSLVATWLPARRATRVDPIEALRAE